MSHKVTYLKEDAIILSEVHDNLRVMLDHMDEMLQIFDSATEPFVHVIDVRNSEVSFDDLIVIANTGARQKKVLFHPMLRELVIVTDKRLIELAAAGMNTTVFGNLKSKIFRNLDDAMAYAKGLALHKA